jgi:hypothetical protein
MPVKTGSWSSILFVLAAFLVFFSLLSLFGSISTDLGSTFLQAILVIGILIMFVLILRRRL